MFAHGYIQHLKRAAKPFAMACCLLPAAAEAQNEGAAVPPPPPPPTPLAVQTGDTPPQVAQSLVPEGVLAMQLADALKLASAPDEAKAEELLSGLGIEPKNGWITEYPVTPAVLGDIEQGVTRAIDQGKLSMTKDQARQLVKEVKAKLNLDLTPGPNVPAGLTQKPPNKTIYGYTDKQGVTHYTDDYDSIPNEYRPVTRIIATSSLPTPAVPPSVDTAQMQASQYAPNVDPEVINNFYYDQGPPVVTYYPPPEPYYYLYTWEPYPFWSTGFFFPGFFILTNFHRHTSFKGRSHFVSRHERHDGFHGHWNAGHGINRTPEQASTGMPPRSSRFLSPGAEAGARGIMQFQNRGRVNRERAAAGINATRPLSSVPASPGSMRLAPGLRTDGRGLPGGLIAPSPPATNRGFNPPVFRQRPFSDQQRFGTQRNFRGDSTLIAPGPPGGTTGGRFRGGGRSGAEGFRGGEGGRTLIAPSSPRGAAGGGFRGGSRGGAEGFRGGGGGRSLIAPPSSGGAAGGGFRGGGGGGHGGGSPGGRGGGGGGHR